MKIMMLGFYQKKFGIRDIGSVLYGLVYFDDAEQERMPRMLWKVKWRDIKKTILGWVKDILVKRIRGEILLSHFLGNGDWRCLSWEIEEGRANGPLRGSRVKALSFREFCLSSINTPVY